MNKIILIDIDDTIIDLITPWVAEINKRYGTNVKLSDIEAWDLSQAFPTLKVEQYCSILEEDEFWKNVKPVEGAVEYITKFINQGFKVYLCSSSDYRTIKSKVINVVFKYFPITWDNIIICSNKQMIKGDYLIDDAIHNLDGGEYEKILFTSPVNSYIDEKLHNVKRVDSWQEIYDYVCNDIKRRMNND